MKILVPIRRKRGVEKVLEKLLISIRTLHHKWPIVTNNLMLQDKMFKSTEQVREIFYIKK